MVLGALCSVTSNSHHPSRSFRMLGLSEATNGIFILFYFIYLFYLFILFYNIHIFIFVCC